MLSLSHTHTHYLIAGTLWWPKYLDVLAAGRETEEEKMRSIDSGSYVENISRVEFHARKFDSAKDSY